MWNKRSGCTHACRQPEPGYNFESSGYPHVFNLIKHMSRVNASEQFNPGARLQPLSVGHDEIERLVRDETPQQEVCVVVKAVVELELVQSEEHLANLQKKKTIR